MDAGGGLTNKRTVASLLCLLGLVCEKVRANDHGKDGDTLCAGCCVSWAPEWVRLCNSHDTQTEERLEPLTVTGTQRRSGSEERDGRGRRAYWDKGLLLALVPSVLPVGVWLVLHGVVGGHG